MSIDRDGGNGRRMKEEKNGGKGDFTVLKRGKIKARTMKRDDA
jgi:hypothetical protein